MNAFKGKYATLFSSKVLKKIDMPLKEIAYELSKRTGKKISMSTYNKWKQGDFAFPPDLISALISMANEKYGASFVDLISGFLLDDTGYFACPDTKKSRIKKIIEKAGRDICVPAMRIIELLNNGYDERDEILELAFKIINQGSAIHQRIMNELENEIKRKESQLLVRNNK